MVPGLLTQPVPTLYVITGANMDGLPALLEE